MPVPAQVPLLQISLLVHALLSSQGVPLGLLAAVHAPELQTPVWQMSLLALQSMAGPLHLPAWQVSPWVQASPSLQLLPAGLSCCRHLPALHTPLWQASSSVAQLTGWAAQAPLPSHLS